MNNLQINVTAVILLLCIPHYSQADGVPVQGRRDLLDKCRKAIISARSNYSAGQLKGTVGYANTVVQIRDLVWRGDNTYADYTKQHFVSLDRKKADQVAVQYVGVENELEIFNWLPKYSVVHRYPRGAASLGHHLQIARGDWFMFQDTQIELERLIDADNPKGSVAGFRVEEKGHLIVIIRENKKTGDDVVFEFDRTIGTLPISYYTTQTDEFTGKYKWKIGSNKIPFLAEYSWSRNIPSKPRAGLKPASPTFQMVIQTWEPQPKLPEAQFTLAGLKLPEGTKVETHAADGSVQQTEWIGGQRPDYGDLPQ